MQINLPVHEKLDAGLTGLVTDQTLSPSASIPVIVRCSADYLPRLVAHAQQVGGQVRHQYTVLGGFSAWVPKAALLELARQAGVEIVEYDQETVVAE